MGAPGQRLLPKNPRGSDPCLVLLDPSRPHLFIFWTRTCLNPSLLSLHPTCPALQNSTPRWTRLPWAVLPHHPCSNRWTHARSACLVHPHPQSSPKAVTLEAGVRMPLPHNRRGPCLWLQSHNPERGHHPSLTTREATGWDVKSGTAQGSPVPPTERSRTLEPARSGFPSVWQGQKTNRS